jgi:hypothetical protein
MNYKAFTNDSLTMMYEGVRGALAADDALKGQDLETRFRVRETPDWKKHAADLEAEMLEMGKCRSARYRSRCPGTIRGLGRSGGSHCDHG